MKKQDKTDDRKKGLIIAILIIASMFLVGYIGYRIENQPKPECKYNYQCDSGLCTNGKCISKEVVTENTRNSDSELANQAASFYRGCLLNCPKECSSCGVLSYKCVASCNDAVESKLNNLNNRDNFLSLLNDGNLQWNSCYEACNTHYPGDGNDYVDYDCIHGCR